MLLNGGDGILQSGAVALGVAGAGRTEGSILTIGQIAAQHDEASGGKSFRQRDQQRSRRVGSGAVGENEGLAVGSFGRCRKPRTWVDDMVKNSGMEASGKGSF